MHDADGNVSQKYGVNPTPHKQQFYWNAALPGIWLVGSLGDEVVTSGVRTGSQLRFRTSFRWDPGTNGG